MTAISKVGPPRVSDAFSERSKQGPRRRAGVSLRSRPDHRGAARRRRGIAATEFAILAPFLTILILGTFELSRGIMVKEVLNDAARKGCRTAIQPLMANSDVTTAVNNILTDNGISTASASLTIQV